MHYSIYINKYQDGNETSWETKSSLHTLLRFYVLKYQITYLFNYHLWRSNYTFTDLQTKQKTYTPHRVLANWASGMWKLRQIPVKGTLTAAVSEVSPHRPNEHLLSVWTPIWRMLFPTDGNRLRPAPNQLEKTERRVENAQAVRAAPATKWRRESTGEECYGELAVRPRNKSVPLLRWKEEETGTLEHAEGKQSLLEVASGMPWMGSGIWWPDKIQDTQLNFNVR